jgi:hypothetical protein
VGNEASFLTPSTCDCSAIPTAWTALICIGRWSLGDTQNGAFAQASCRWRSKHCASADMADDVPIASPSVTSRMTFPRNTMLAHHCQTSRSRCDCRHMPSVPCSGCRMVHRVTTSNFPCIKAYCSLYMHVFSCISARPSLRIHDEHFLTGKPACYQASHELQLNPFNAIGSPTQRRPVGP